MDTSGLPGGVKKRSTFDIDSAEISKLTQQGRPEHLKDVGNWVTPPRRDPDVPEEDPFPVLPVRITHFSVVINNFSWITMIMMMASGMTI